MWLSKLINISGFHKLLVSISRKQPDEALLKKHPIFTAGFTKRELADFLSLGKSVQYPAGTIIFNEDEEANSFYLIVQGEAEVFKEAINEYGQNHRHILAVLKEDDIVGDMALIENKPRSTSLRAKTDVTVLCFKLEKIQEKPDLNLRLTNNIARILSERLRYNNEVTIKNMEESLNQAMGRNALGTFLIALLWLFCLYTLSIRELIFVRTQLTISTPLSAGMIFIFAVVIFIAMRLTTLPYSSFGITLHNWRNVTLQALVYSIPFAIIVLAIKACLVYLPTHSHYSHLFSGAPLSWGYYLTMIFVYSLFSPAQELITRSATQTTFYLFLPGSDTFRKWNAIILSNLLFATIHSHLSLMFSAVVFVPGLFWGWLFHKQRSVIGVSVSHIVLGVWALFIIGF
jgi:CRP-like cAMP-binding protein